MSIIANGTTISDVSARDQPIYEVIAVHGGTQTPVFEKQYTLTISKGIGVKTASIKLTSRRIPDSLVGQYLPTNAAIYYGDVLEASGTLLTGYGNLTITKSPNTPYITGNTTFTFSATKVACNSKCTTNTSSSRCTKCTISVGSSCAVCDMSTSLSGPGNPEEPGIEELRDWAVQQDQDLSEFVETLDEKEGN